MNSARSVSVSQFQWGEETLCPPRRRSGSTPGSGPDRTIRRDARSRRQESSHRVPATPARDRARATYSTRRTNSSSTCRVATMTVISGARRWGLSWHSRGTAIVAVLVAPACSATLGTACVGLVRSAICGGGPAAPARRGGARRSLQRRPAALQDRPAPTPARQQRPSRSRCRSPSSPTARPRRPQPQPLAPAILTRTVGCLPPLIRPPFCTSDAFGTERPPPALRAICRATNLGSGRAAQHRLRRLRRIVDCVEKGR